MEQPVAQDAPCFANYGLFVICMDKKPYLEKYKTVTIFWWQFVAQKYCSEISQLILQNIVEDGERLLNFTRHFQ